MAVDKIFAASCVWYLTWVGGGGKWMSGRQVSVCYVKVLNASCVLALGGSCHTVILLVTWCRRYGERLWQMTMQLKYKACVFSIGLSC